jgi:hypothetical protein
LCVVDKDSNNASCSSSISPPPPSRPWAPPPPTIPDAENLLASLSSCPRRPPSSSHNHRPRRTRWRKRGRRLLPPFSVVEGTAPPCSPETPAQLDGVAAAGLATRKRSERSSWYEPSRCRCSSTKEL